YTPWSRTSLRARQHVAAGRLSYRQGRPSSSQLARDSTRETTELACCAERGRSSGPSVGSTWQNARVRQTAGGYPAARGNSFRYSCWSHSSVALATDDQALQSQGAQLR